MQSHSRDDIGVLEEFRIEFWKFWERLPNKGFFLGLLVAWLALFHLFGNSTRGYIPTDSIFVWMYEAYNPEQSGEIIAEDAHGNLIPFLVLGLLWWKRDELLANRLRLWWPAIFMVGGALVLHLLGFAVQQTRLSIMALFIGIYGLTGLAWGPGFMISSFFPMFLFAFSVPMGSMAESVSFPLRVLVCRLVEFFCHNVLFIDILRQGTALVEPSGKYQYEVAAACSGIRSLVSTILLAVVYAFVSYKSWWKRGVVIASAVPFAVLGNFARMMMIILAAEIEGHEAGKWVHDSSVFSLIPYVPAIFGLFLFGRYLGEDAPTKPRPPAPSSTGGDGGQPLAVAEARTA